MYETQKYELKQSKEDLERLRNNVKYLTGKSMKVEKERSYQMINSWIWKQGQ